MSDEDKSISIITESYEVTELKSGLPSIPQLVTKVVQVNEEDLRDNLDKFLGNMFNVLSSIKTESDEYEVDTVQLSLMIGATGEVAICGTLKGGISGQTSLLLTLKRKQKTT